MKISIITPCRSNDLHRMIELENSLVHQNNNDFEWIIACNEELDGLYQANFPIKIVNYYPDTVGAARNAALKNASGEYLLFIDADDYLSSDAINKAIPLLKNNRIIDLNIYYTYEPTESFVAKLNDKDAKPDLMPKWGGKKRRRPINRDFNYISQLSNSFSNINNKYNQWLQNKYWIFKNQNHYDRIGRQISIVGKFIPKQIVDNYQLSFEERNILYSNVTFTLLSIEHTDETIQLSGFNYIKVRHNDPINDPSLTQLDRSDRWEKWIYACFYGWLELDDSNLKLAFSQYTVHKIHRFLYKAIISKAPSIDGSVKDTLIVLQKYLQLLNNNAYDHINVFSKNILFKIRAGEFKKAQKLMLPMIGSREVHRLIKHHGRGITKDSYKVLFKYFPVNTKVIIYESFLGRNYSDSPKYIYQYIQQHYPGKFLNVWIADKDNINNIKNDLKDQPNTIVVKRFGFKYMKYLATSKYQIFNMRQPKWFVKRPNTKFIETWHGTPLKHLVFDMDNVASATPLYKKIFYYQSRAWDNLVTANQYSYDIFNHAFMYPKDQMIQSGYPRNDILNSSNRDAKARKIKERLGIPLNKKVILYAPTWRDDQYFAAGQYKFKLKLDIAKLREQLGNDYVMILRTHYFITNNLDTSSFGNFVYNESNYDDIAELYLASDILITDYSSVFFDYAILQRPILYYVYDYDNYASVLRGFYLNMKKDLPGPLLKTSDDVLSAIKNIDQVKSEYHDKYRRFNNRFNTWDDGNASKRVVDNLLKDDPRIHGEY